MALTMSQINQLELCNLNDSLPIPDRLNDAYLLGQAAFHELVPYTCCPLTEDDEREEWHRGWTVEQFDILTP